MIKFVQNVLYYFFILVLFFLFGSLVSCLESRFCCDFLMILKHNHILSRSSLITLYHITIITKNCEHFCNPKLLLTYRKSNWSKPKDSHRGSLFHLSYLPRCSNSCNHMRTCLEALKRKKKIIYEPVFNFGSNHLHFANITKKIGKKNRRETSCDPIIIILIILQFNTTISGLWGSP